MAITEARRFEMHLELKKRLGDDVADTLMEHLPPGGWDDVVRVRDLAPLKMQIDHLDKRLGAVITIGVGVGLALIGLQVQIMLTIANL